MSLRSSQIYITQVSLNSIEVISRTPDLMQFAALLLTPSIVSRPMNLVNDEDWLLPHFFASVHFLLEDSINQAHVNLVKLCSNILPHFMLKSAES